MISELDIIGRAAQIKAAMLSRSEQIQQKSVIVGRSRAGLAPDVKQDRLDTLEIELKNLAIKQERDGVAFAALRWVLGLTEDIEPNNLQLDL